MTSIADVIGWKFDNQPDMQCAEDQSGNLVIVGFPGGVPSQADQDAWTTEYEAFLAGPQNFPLNPFQFFTFMDRIGLTEAMVDNAIDRATSDPNKRIEHKRRFRHASTFKRDHPLLVSLVLLVGKTEAEIDTAWLAAKDLT